MAKFKTKQDAVALLDRIQNYWSERGYLVQGAIHDVGYNERIRSTLYEVHTDLRNGMPVRRAV